MTLMRLLTAAVVALLAVQTGAQEQRTRAVVVMTCDGIDKSIEQVFVPKDDWFIQSFGVITTGQQININQRAPAGVLRSDTGRLVACNARITSSHKFLRTSQDFVLMGYEVEGRHGQSGTPPPFNAVAEVRMSVDDGGKSASWAVIAKYPRKASMALKFKISYVDGDPEPLAGQMRPSSRPQPVAPETPSARSLEPKSAVVAQNQGAVSICYDPRKLNFAGCEGQYTYLCNSTAVPQTRRVLYADGASGTRVTLETTVTAPAGAGIGTTELVGGSVFGMGGVCYSRNWTIAPGQ